MVQTSQYLIKINKPIKTERGQWVGRGGGWWWSGQRMWQTFFRRRYIQIGNRYTKRCSTSLLIREMQTKTTMRHHRTPVSMAIIKKNRNNKRWKGCGNSLLVEIPCWWERKLLQPLWKTVWQLLKKHKLELLYDLAILSVYLKEKNTNLTRYVPPQCL